MGFDKGNTPKKTEIWGDVKRVSELTRTFSLVDMFDPPGGGSKIPIIHTEMQQAIKMLIYQYYNEFHHSLAVNDFTTNQNGILTKHF